MEFLDSLLKLDFEDRKKIPACILLVLGRPEAEIVKEMEYLLKSIQSKKNNSLKKKFAKIALRLYAPVAEKQGRFHLKELLEDTAFQVLWPKEHHFVVKKINHLERVEKRVLKNIEKELNELMAPLRMHTEINGRFKSAYSIFLKLQKKGTLDLKHLNDLFGYRVIVESDDESACYRIFSWVNEKYIPLPAHCKDYIAYPKLNGYQSLHTVVKGIKFAPEWPLEIQIRTRAMHEAAEFGPAAHFAYHLNKNSTEKLAVPQEGMMAVLTRDRQVMLMPRGSTVNDFARKLHSSFPRRLSYATVNGVKVESAQELRSGDHVILTLQA